MSSTEATTSPPQRVLDTMRSFRSKGKYCDLLLVVERNNQFPAHRVVLAAGSPFFAVSDDDDDSAVPVGRRKIVMPENVTADAMEFLLDWMYSGSCEVSHSKTPSNLLFLKSVETAATCLRIDSLQDFIARKRAEIQGPGHRMSPGDHVLVKEEAGEEEEEDEEDDEEVSERGTESSSEDEGHTRSDKSLFQRSMESFVNPNPISRLKTIRSTNLSLRMVNCQDCGRGVNQSDLARHKATFHSSSRRPLAIEEAGRNERPISRVLHIRKPRGINSAVPKFIRGRLESTMETNGGAQCDSQLEDGSQSGESGTESPFNADSFSTDPFNLAHTNSNMNTQPASQLTLEPPSKVARISPSPSTDPDPAQCSIKSLLGSFSDPDLSPRSSSAVFPGPSPQSSLISPSLFNSAPPKPSPKSPIKMPCHICGLLLGESSMTQHIARAHAPDDESHACPECGKVFRTSGNLKIHSRVHGVTPPSEKQLFSCETCHNYETHDKGQLRHHAWTLHGINIDEGKVFSCPSCDVTTPVEAIMKRHISEKHLTRLMTISCAQCDKMFRTKAMMRSHVMRVHCAGEEASCHICGATFKSQTGMSYHLWRIHKVGKNGSGQDDAEQRLEKPFKCPYCSHTSGLSGNVRKHVMNVHKGMQVDYVDLRKMMNSIEYNGPMSGNDDESRSNSAVSSAPTNC